MASEVPKKMIKIRFEGSFSVSADYLKFGIGGVISSAAICFPSHRSLFHCLQGAQCPPEVNVLHSWAVVLSKFSGKSSLYE